MTTDMEAFFNQQTGMNLTPIFNEYLRHASIPVLELRFNDTANAVSYRWNAEEKDLAMPVRVGQKDHRQMVYP